MLDLMLSAASEWAGVDQTVVGRFAEQAGRHSWRPLLDTDQGDLLLFLFLCAGIVGGFVIGYYFRVLFVEKFDLPRKRGAA